MKKPNPINAWYGWVPDRPDHRDLLYSTIAAPLPTLPAAVDLRPSCSPVENQGQLGSCTANALVGSLEFLEAKAGKKATDLSRLFIYYNERALEGTVKEDAGAMIRDGVKTLVKQGVCAEKLWRYNIAKFAVKPPAACYQQALSHQVQSYHRIITLQDMLTCLAEGYSFVFGFTVYEAFESKEVAKTGQLNLPKHGEKALGGHAVMAVGYDDASKRFVVRNSWGKAWGMQGYFTIPYAYLEDRNLADDFWTLRVLENP
jgi:C1A family cysteine protease